MAAAATSGNAQNVLTVTNNTPVPVNFTIDLYGAPACKGYATKYIPSTPYQVGPGQTFSLTYLTFSAQPGATGTPAATDIFDRAKVWDACGGTAPINATEAGSPCIPTSKKISKLVSCGAPVQVTYDDSVPSNVQLLFQ